MNDHYANVFPRIATYATHPPTSKDHLVNAFCAQSHVSSTGLDWYFNIDVINHMTYSSSSVTHVAPYLSPNQVAFGNG